MRCFARKAIFQGGPEAASLNHCKEQALRWEEYHGTAPSVPAPRSAGKLGTGEPRSPRSRGPESRGQGGLR